MGKKTKNVIGIIMVFALGFILGLVVGRSENFHGDKQENAQVHETEEDSTNNMGDDGVSKDDENTQNMQNDQNQDIDESDNSEETIGQESSNIEGDGQSEEDSDSDQAGIIVYQNDDYGFTVTLPSSWEGYSVIEDQWVADVFDTEGNAVDGDTVSGPKILLRHPDYTEDQPRQDIPVLILTHDQWEEMSEEENGGNATLHIGAAPIGPSKLAENTDYVFALPARYNYAFPEGYEEVEELIEDGALQAYELN